MRQLSAVAGPVRNLLLASLPPEELSQVRPLLETVQLEQQALLFAPGVPIHHVYFPETSVISVVTRLKSGATQEVGTAGCEGMVGLTLFLAEEASAATAFVQIPGIARRMRAAAFTRLASVPGALHQVLLRYAEAFLSQVTQTAACNATHLVGERCARWLLATRDRVETDRFPLTEEYLALMLGVRRGGVSVAMHQLQQAGMVQCGQGEIEVLDRAKLEEASCECYRTVRSRFERLLPRPVTGGAMPNAYVHARTL